MASLGHQSAAAAGADASPASLAIHRVRFVNWSPSTVTALAVSPSFAGTARGLLAIGRQNGNIELCTWVGPRAAQKSEFDDRAFQSDAAGWAVHTILPGQTNSKIEQLCFVNPPTQDTTQPRKLRLFSISGGSIVTEHFIPLHLARLGARRDADVDDDDSQPSKPRPGTISALFGSKSASNLDPHYPGETRTLPSLAGAVWSMAPSATGRYLALGCEDGSVRIIDLENDRFEHLASTSGQDRRIVPRFGKAKGKVISLCWGPPIRSSKRTDSAKKATSSDSDNDSEDDDSSSSSDDDSDDDDDDDEHQWHESFLVGGLALSTAVVWDASTGNIATKLAVQKNRTESTIVWSVATLPDGTIVTGDSTGRVTFFDARTRIPIPEATFRAHAASSDVLALCIGPDGKTVYSAGVDQKVAEYTKIETSNGRERWIQIASRRLHAHDIRALALDPPYSPLDAAQAIANGTGDRAALSRLPVLLSGGVDFNLVLTPAAPPSAIVKAQKAATLASIPSAKAKPNRATLNKVEQEHAAINPISSNPLTTFPDTTQRRVPFVPTAARGGLLGGGGVAALCASKGWIVLRREQSIGIWDLGSQSELLSVAQASQAGEPLQQHSPSWAKLLEMEVKVDSNLVAVAISHDGRYLAFSDLYETRLFELKQRRRPDAEPVELEPKKIKSFGRVFGGQQRIAPSASVLKFSPDSTRLVVCSLTGAYVHVLELPSHANGDSCKLLRSFGHHRKAAATGGQPGDQRQLAGRSTTNGDTNGHTAPQTDRVERSTTTVIQHAEISHDGAWLSTLSSDLQHHVFSLDSLTYGRTLPSPASLPSGVVFHPSTSAHFSSMLTLVFADNKLEFWDVESGKELTTARAPVDATAATTEGSRTQCKRATHSHTRTGSTATTASTAADSRTTLVDNLSALKHTLQLRLASLRDFAISALWCGDGSGNLANYTLVVYGATWMCTARAVARSDDVDAQGDVEMHDAAAAGVAQHGALQWTVRTTAKYQPLLLVAQLAVAGAPAAHLVVVERPYFELAKKLPAAFHRGARYGA
ncbi:related to UTP4-U3 snoRNP protein [Sporisorium reilianum f. sp. reilianum]|uniref:Related to UTP4-U3 snoRNP protein n=1 Tax=Sporisorium reilianum f. sp. reilianum TaxID=72559 RepID=A0A2N8U6K3_9BASI|nr:related to UTP4-U3 snoRNP protein [Sporisorium reilianum f. sp. reilianum]